MKQLGRRFSHGSKTQQVHFRAAAVLIKRFREVAASLRLEPTEAHRTALKAFIDHHATEGCSIAGDVQISIRGRRLILSLFAKDEDEFVVRVTGSAAGKLLVWLKSIGECEVSEWVSKVMGPGSGESGSRKETSERRGRA